MDEAATLAEYSACDVSDALMKLKVPGAGFLPDILPLSTFLPPKTSNNQSTRLALPISTILFAPKSPAQKPVSETPLQPSNIDTSSHWTDLPAPNTIAVIQQPQGQSCAVVGDILATRLKVRGVRGIVVDGRVRDLQAMQDLTDDGGFVVWNKATSTVGSGLEAKAWAADVPLSIGNVVVKPGDILLIDVAERGSVVIPREKLESVLEMMPGIKRADDAVVNDVLSGTNVKEAFQKHRGE